MKIVLKQALSIFLVIGIIIASSVGAAPLWTVFAEGEPGFSVINLKTDYMTKPIGIDSTNPRFSWQMSSDKIGEMQTRYSITVAKDVDLTDRVWESGAVASDSSFNIMYNGLALQPKTRYYWRVSVTDNNGSTVQSAVEFFETGMLGGAWAAKRIGIENASSAEMLRKKFSTSNGKTVRSARLYATALGLYEAYINGNKVGSDYLNPGWTDYEERVLYQTYDVTDMVQSGDNVIGVILGNGWYSGHISSSYQLYGTQPTFLGQLEITYTDGTIQTIASANDWKTYGNGPIVSDDIQNGTTYDARKEVNGWLETSFDDSLWTAAREYQWVSSRTGSNGEPISMGVITAQSSPTIQRKQTFIPVAIIAVGDGSYTIDFGQNFAGFCTLNIPACAIGTEIKLQHGERLNNNGSVYTTNLATEGNRPALQLDKFISNGLASVYTPMFTYHGFRYVQISGFPVELTMENAAQYITATAISTAVTNTIQFSSSSDKVNKLWSNSLWSQYSNFMSIPTDCPQRSERSGWLGDISAFGTTSMYNAYTLPFMKKWFNDIVDAKSGTDGALPDVAPRTNNYDGNLEGHTVWGDAMINLAYDMYKIYGDKTVLEDYYDTYKAWIGYYQANSKDYIYIPKTSSDPEGADYGDWLNRDVATPTNLVGTAYFSNSSRIMAEIAKILGNTDDYNTYIALSENVKKAFVEKFVTTSGYGKGTVGTGTQTAYTLALAFGLLPEEIEPYAIDNFVTLIAKNNYRTYNGYASISYYLPALSEIGRSDKAYDCLLCTGDPSWLYAVDQGLTTMAESWWPNATYGSQNHYILGCVNEWIYRYMAGINYDSEVPGFKKTILRPEFDTQERITSVECTYSSVYGDITSNWSKNNEEESYTYTVVIPANTTAEFHIPTTYAYLGSTDICNLSAASGVSNVHAGKDEVICTLASGEYEFTLTNTADAASAAAVQAVEQGAIALPDIWSITYNDYDTVKSVYDAYSVLTESQKLDVDNRDELLEKYNEVSCMKEEHDSGLEDDTILASFLSRRIEKLPHADELTLSDRTLIDTAYTFYDGLSDNAKEKVLNLDSLLCCKFVLDNLPTGEGKTVTLVLNSAQGPANEYYNLPTGVTLYAGDKVIVPADIITAQDGNSGQILNVSTSNGWNGWVSSNKPLTLNLQGSTSIWANEIGSGKFSFTKLCTVNVELHMDNDDIIAAYELNKKISGLKDPAVMVESEYTEDVVPLRSEYESLHNEAKALVDIARLDDYDEMFEATEVEAVVIKINRIPDLAEITAESADIVETARAAYDALSEADRADVTNYKKLCDSEIVLSKFHTAQTITLVENSLTGPEDKYYRLPDNVSHVYLGDKIKFVQSWHIFRSPDSASSGGLVNIGMAATNDWNYINVNGSTGATIDVSRVGAFSIYCYSLTGGDVNPRFKLITLNVLQPPTAAEIADAIALRDEIDASVHGSDALRSRYEALRPDLQDIVDTTKLAYTTAEIVKDGSAHTVDVQMHYISTVKTLLVCGYKNNELIDLNISYRNSDTSVVLNGDFDVIKVFTWEDFDRLIPVTKETVIESNEFQTN